MKFLLIQFIALVIAISSDSLGFINEKVTTQSSLAPLQLTQEISVEATCLIETKVYTIALPSALSASEKLAFVQVKGGSSGSKTKQILSHLIKESEINVDLGKIVKNGDSIELEIKLVWTKVTKAYPKEVSQTDTAQMYEMNGNILFYSPYSTQSQKQIITLPNSKEPLAYGKEIDKVSRSGNIITYGPYSDIKPLSVKKLYLHFYDNRAGLVAKTYEKTYKVSYWTPELHVQEDFELHHEGAKLKGYFSRVDFKLSVHGHSQTSVVKEMTAILPAEATDVFYKDVTGNISTSHFRKEKQRSVLELTPRYPLYGGWRFSWFHGYTIPQSLLLNQLSGKAEDYRFKATLTPSVSGLIVEKSTLKVILPEGAEVNSPFALDRESRLLTYTYFDTTGRPTIVLEKNNVVDELSSPIQITYTYPSIKFWQKPAAIVGSILAFLLVAFTLGSLDLSIVPNEDKKIAAALAQISGLIEKEKKSITNLSSALTNYKADKDIKALRAVQDASYSVLESVQSILISSFDLNAEFSKKVKALANQFKSRLDTIKQLHVSVVTFLESKDTENEERRMRFTKIVDSINSTLDAIESKIDNIRSNL